VSLRHTFQERSGSRFVASAASRVVQRKGLPLQNHRRVGMSPAGEQSERQAEDAARRALRGETNVGRYLTPAPPASLFLPLSPGRPLRRELQAPLDTSFGAELSAVRLHVDPHAAAAAHSYRAQAFTAGRDICFGDSSPDPATEQGSHLLLHEIAHVLQQTGRRESTGRLQATSPTGAGEIQRRPGRAMESFNRIWTAL